MHRFITSALSLSLLILSPVPFAFGGEQLDNSSEEALIKTKTLLRSRQKRNNYINENPKAREADNTARAVSDNPAHVDEIYDISADVMDSIVRETGGDVMKMQELMREAAANPKAFHHRLSASQKARIRKLAAEVEAEKVKED